MPTYKRYELHEQILARPDTYVGSVKEQTQHHLVADEHGVVEYRPITIVPALYKIIDELIVNAIDASVVDESVTHIGIAVSATEITVTNNGVGITTAVHEEEGIHTPELIFGVLLTSSNYDDTQERFTGGRNGFGAKLANVFSHRFKLVVKDVNGGKEYTQVWEDHMRTRHEPTIKTLRTKSGGVSISVRPSLCEAISEDMMALLRRRAMDVAMCTRQGVRVTFNDNAVKLRTIEAYATACGYKPVLSFKTPQWSVALGVPAEGCDFRGISFVNGVCTWLGGTHVDAVASMLNAVARTKFPVSRMKQHAVIFVTGLMANPEFNSQLKESLTSPVAKVPLLDARDAKKLLSSGICSEMSNAHSRREADKAAQADRSARRATRLNIEKLEDATRAGIPGSGCSLFLTEGDSAKTMVISGMSEIGRDRFGVYPLRGKIINVRNKEQKDIIANQEITNIRRIVGLEYGRTYTERDVKRLLRYEHVVLLTDADVDGFHIKGLILNFFECQFPSLLAIPGFLQFFVTPQVTVDVGSKRKLEFYNEREFTDWAAHHPHEAKRARYLKGLGTSTRTDALGYFKAMAKNLKNFVYTEADAPSLTMAFDKNQTLQRKTWLINYWTMEGDAPTPDYGKRDHSVTPFVNEELIQFSDSDTRRSIPNLMDGLKTSQRKVICDFLRHPARVKVATAAGRISAAFHYHHGEQSLQKAIIALAWDFVGSNQLPPLIAEGQFGSRLQGGNDAASARYLETSLNPIMRRIYIDADMELIPDVVTDFHTCEKEFLLPIIPMVLVNGAEGIGTGWSTSVPTFSVPLIVKSLRALLNDEEPMAIHPHFRGFKGTIVMINDHNYASRGVCTATAYGTQITELPLGVWTEPFVEKLTKQHEGVAIENHSTDIIVDIRVHAEVKPPSKSINIDNMNLWPIFGAVTTYPSAEAVLRAFYEARLPWYEKRRQHLIVKLSNEIDVVSSKARFIREIINGELVVFRVPKATIIAKLEEGLYHKVDGSHDYLLRMHIQSFSKEDAERLDNRVEQLIAERSALRQKTDKELWRADLDELVDALGMPPPVGGLARTPTM